MGLSHPNALVTFLPSMYQWARLVEDSNALIYMRTWTRCYGRANFIEGYVPNKLSVLKEVGTTVWGSA